MYSATNLLARESDKEMCVGMLYVGAMTIHERLLQVRKDAKLTQADLAKKVGVTRGAVAQWEAEDGTVPKRSTLRAIAVATGRDLAWIEFGVDNAVSGLNVVGEVSAGTWREGTVEFKSYGVPVSPHGSYPPESQRLYKVSGTSVNKIVPDGAFVHCVNVIDGGLTPEHGDLVIVRRLDHDRAEYTAKRLIKDGDRWILRPESDDPQWQSDLVLNGDDGTEIEIIDIVIAIWQPLRRGM